MITLLTLIFSAKKNELLDIYLRDIAGYNRSFNNLYGIHNYGILMSIDYHKNEKPIVPFLKEIPELLAYDEETPKGIDYYAIIDKNPPKNLNDLA